mmetsp:Transcript_490/g.856  ORF Transcript_490/g.856 Transcript_490/m.856 type:complete len:345 (-) Transcript_490:44-1078(-)
MRAQAPSDPLRKLLGVYDGLKESSTPDNVQQNGDKVSKKRPLKAEAPKNTENGKGCDENAKKKKRYTWSNDLHRQFMGTIFDLGLKSAKPKLILQMMNVDSKELTTEHIKSHLQKYRVNSKKTKQLFLEQFEIARKAAEVSNRGKALNPGFHAYPMPVGDYPLDKSSQLGAERQNPCNCKLGIHEAPRGCRSHVCERYPSSFSANCNSCHSCGPKIAPGCGGSCSCCTSRHDGGVDRHVAPNIPNSHNPVVFDRMEVQMRIHQQMQERHDFQHPRASHYYRNDNHTNQKSQHDSGSDETRKDLDSKPSFEQETEPFQPFKLGLDDLDDGDNLGSMEDNLFNFLD